ncbi:hypothetical protein EAG14_10620 [Acidovorax sp. 1608163]|uniref:ATP-binding protein n=1 Tax=Acidovorax sp. 1608163 TaxID=2478662 RepID=UPI000EF66EA8|nr:ATP-binding protein [Acidovorax sp. 1608163]AYM96449.1 hypothetical protein EAG14_10620 [Acidovorax sp. 1608163]
MLIFYQVGLMGINASQCQPVHRHALNAHPVIPMRIKISYKENKLTPVKPVEHVGGADKPKSPIFSNGWIQYPDSAEIAVVFVHGFLSNASDCWKGKSGHSWPDLIKADPKFKECAVFVSEYHTIANSGEYDIEQSTNELFNRFSFEPSSEYRPVLNFTNIIFVCHSLGGILVRRLVEQQKHLLIEKAIGLFLVASPSGGSEYAKTFDIVGRLYKNKVVRQLNSGSEVLNDLDGRFRDLLHKKTIPRLVGAEVSENYGPVWAEWLPIRTKPIVEKSSSSRYFGVATIIPGSDHFNIAKPGSVNSAIYVNFLRFFDQSFKPILEKACIEKSKQQMANVLTEEVKQDANALFDIYKIECKPYYLLRDADLEFEEIIKYSSVWICGPSGCGKTSLARYAVFSLGKPVATQIDLGLAYEAGNIEACYEAIVSTYRSLGLTDLDRPSYNFADAVGVLVKAHSSQSAVRILLDEIPLNNSSGVRLTEFLLNLIVKVNSASKANIRFVICSINTPSNDLMTDKVQESLQVNALDMWSKDELMSLIKLIEESVGLQLGADDLRIRLVELDLCTPRKIKNFFRRVVALGGASPDNVETALSEFEFYGNGNE